MYFLIRANLCNEGMHVDKTRLNEQFYARDICSKQSHGPPPPVDKDYVDPQCCRFRVEKKKSLNIDRNQLLNTVVVNRRIVKTIKYHTVYSDGEEIGE